MSQLAFAFITSLAMFRKWPGWKEPTETVRSDRTHFSAMPLSPFSPLLMSTETTYAPLSLMRSMASAAAPFTSPWNPVPKMQSTIVPKPASAMPLSHIRTGTPASRHSVR